MLLEHNLHTQNYRLHLVFLPIKQSTYNSPFYYTVPVEPISPPNSELSRFGGGVGYRTPVLSTFCSTSTSRILYIPQKYCLCQYLTQDFILHQLWQPIYFLDLFRHMGHLDNYPFCLALPRTFLQRHHLLELHISKTFYQN